MLRTDLADYRRSPDPELVDGLRRHDPLALAEAYHRTIPAAHACARRLLSPSNEVEALLRAVYGELWDSPPGDGPLEGWIRGRCFAVGGEHLRQRNAAPATPSLGVLLPDLPATEARYLDAAERAVAELDPAERRALLRAHDAGLPTHEHGDADAAQALERALVHLAGPEGGEEGGCTDLDSLGDWVLGLLAGPLAEAIEAQVAARPECSQRVRVLRRGRRRLEGLPPTPDMGQRILVSVLAEGPTPTIAPPAPAPAAPPPEDEAVVPLTRAAPPAAAPVTPAGLDEPRPGSALDDDELGATGDLRLSDVLAADEAAPRSSINPYEELAALADSEGAQKAPAPSDEDSGDLLGFVEPDDEDEEGRSPGGRVLRILGYLLLLALGAFVGLYVGSWFVAR